MKLTGPACTEAMSGAEEDGTRERAEGNAGGVRVERRVRALGCFRDPGSTVVEPFVGTLVEKGKNNPRLVFSRIRSDQFL